MSTLTLAAQPNQLTPQTAAQPLMTAFTPVAALTVADTRASVMPAITLSPTVASREGGVTDRQVGWAVEGHGQSTSAVGYNMEEAKSAVAS